MSAVSNPTRHKLSVEDYHKLGEAGILREDSRVELIDGELMDMAPIGAAHMRIVNRLTRLLVLAVGDLGVVSIQNPITLPPHSEPQPDVVILSPGSDHIEAPVPGPREALLVSEVADTTVAYDRSTKLSLYAEAGIAEVWIVNVPAQCVEVYRDPVAGAYMAKSEAGSGDLLSPSRLPPVTVQVAELFR
jgi:Uma2 family endonuclease